MLVPMCLCLHHNGCMCEGYTTVHPRHHACMQLYLGNEPVMFLEAGFVLFATLATVSL